jgi:DNA-binding NtrC family response regulator
MTDLNVLKGKRILVVDDEPDILETLIDLLDMCFVETAQEFATAEKSIRKGNYDAVILDIMGVDGYKLLKIATEKGIPAVMLTAHALSPTYLIKSIKEGAHAYLPKDKMVDIADFLAELIQSRQKGIKRSGAWFEKLRPFFDEKFGTGWREKDKDFWKDFEKSYVPSKEDVRKLL